MASMNDVIVAVCGVVVALLGASIYVTVKKTKANNKTKNINKVNQGGIGSVRNTATFNQDTNNENHGS